MFPNDLVEEIKVYQEENNIRSNNEAIRTLIRKGLEDSRE
jgi:metal-responsive CopG/Arc/MetJ family transcriptional regulator